MLFSKRHNSMGGYQGQNLALLFALRFRNYATLLIIQFGLLVTALKLVIDGFNYTNLYFSFTLSQCPILYFRYAIQLCYYAVQLCCYAVQ